jgi:hypothetical protein
MNIIARTFQELFGQPCWGLDHGQYNNLSMNFGKPTLHVQEPHATKSKSDTVRWLAAKRIVRPHGRWRLWLTCCYWRLSSDEKQLATGSCSLRRIECAMAHLNGQKLISAHVEPATGATRFTFDLGGVLDCRRFEKDSDLELWILYKPSKYCLSIYGNGTFTHQRGSTKPKERQFQSIDKLVRDER